MLQSQENMELTSSLETERHTAKELAAKLSYMGVEFEESKQLLSSQNAEIQILREELQTTSESLREEVKESFISFDTELIQRMTDDNVLHVIYVTRIPHNFQPWQGILSQNYSFFHCFVLANFC